MDEIIQIKCPFDGVILSVKNQPDIETKTSHAQYVNINTHSLNTNELFLL